MPNIYVASSWRNPYYKQVVKRLRACASLRPQRSHGSRMVGRARQEGRGVYPEDGGTEAGFGDDLAQFGAGVLLAVGIGILILEDVLAIRSVTPPAERCCKRGLANVPGKE